MQTVTQSPPNHDKIFGDPEKPKNYPYHTSFCNICFIPLRSLTSARLLKGILRDYLDFRISSKYLTLGIFHEKSVIYLIEIAIFVL